MNFYLTITCLEKVELWFSIVANGVTILGLITFFISAFIFIKNRFSKFTIKLVVEHIKGKEFSYTLYNSTNKEFAVTDISLMFGKKYISAKELVKSDLGAPIWETIKYIHIPAYGHFNGMCEFQTNCELSKTLKFKISTTHKTLKYCIKYTDATDNTDNTNSKAEE